MSERVHPWQECNERLEARAAARRWRRRHQHQDAGRCHAGGKATARTAPGTPCKHSAHCLHFPRIAYQNLRSSPNRMPATSGAAGLYVRPISENRAAPRPFCTVSLVVHQLPPLRVAFALFTPPSSLPIRRTIRSSTSTSSAYPQRFVPGSPAASQPPTVLPRREQQPG